MDATAVTVEACVVSARQADSCFDAGAHRVELCRDLSVGGLTPDSEEVRAALASARGPVHVLVRPRAGGFRVRGAELDALLEDVARVVGQGVAGVVAGVLDEGGSIDVEAMAAILAACVGVPVTFHRAFDELSDPLRGLAVLHRLGVARVLTSGGARDAWAGRSVLKDLVRASTDVTILGGGAVRGFHVRALLEETGLQEIHARASAIPDLIQALAPGAAGMSPPGPTGSTNGP
jgi:copper homeostasis protein